MFSYRQFYKLHLFSQGLKNKGFTICFEFEDNKMFVEFEYDEFRFLEKYIKDWLIFNSDIISAYDVEWTDDEVCRFNLYFNRGDC